jgi:thermitase
VTTFSYYVGDRLAQLHTVDRVSAERTGRRRARPGGRGAHVRAAVSNRTALVQGALAADPAGRTRFHELEPSEIPVLAAADAQTLVIPTETLIVEGATRDVEAWLKDKWGATKVDEGRQGKALFRVPGDGRDAIGEAFAAARDVFEKKDVAAAHPNFMRAIALLSPSNYVEPRQWNLHNDGDPGLYGADVHARAAWTITRGHADAVVAVLDEGVDTAHPALKDAVVAEADFVEQHRHARPSGDDAHGTACAGVVASRAEAVPGLARDASLMAVRIAMGDGQGNWIFDDFRTADAVDWTWQNGACVLSNSWGGGPPVDVIARAFERARTKGRGGKGCVIVIAAGNEEGRVTFPGTLPNVLTVGASNAWDERKTHRSKDGEDWWGSNFGPTLDLLAPGVKVPSTDLRGRRGFGKDGYTGRFNGTSAAAPHVAAAAALILAAAPRLTEQQVREAITGSCDLVPGQKKWNANQGHGRLNAYAAIRAALR